MTLGFFGAISVESIVIYDAVNNKLTPQGYPESQFLGISAYSYEYGLAFYNNFRSFYFLWWIIYGFQKAKTRFYKIEHIM